MIRDEFEQVTDFANGKKKHCHLLKIILFDSHNLVHLNNLATSQGNHFQLLIWAYVDARCSEHYEITAEQLDWLIAQVEVLQGLTKELCVGRIEEFSRKGR